MRSSQEPTKWPLPRVDGEGRGRGENDDQPSGQDHALAVHCNVGQAVAAGSQVMGFKECTSQSLRFFRCTLSVSGLCDSSGSNDVEVYGLGMVAISRAPVASPERPFPQDCSVLPTDPTDTSVHDFIPRKRGSASTNLICSQVSRERLL